ncbi:hypothetical protein TNCV_3118141 [Trichonephila clavipes]|uniref:Uncharacterized protein n=1 Tax=Trichonephila clavipes TaxID=2585209 RepID=A0A8X6W941_TRICX|nr:hypothetical protein TNCV_3118141 [Trichonephila clavipes]
MFLVPGKSSQNREIREIEVRYIEDDEMMNHDSYSENSAINLSTTQVVRGSASAANGAGDSEDSQSSTFKESDYVRNRDFQKRING